MSAAKRKIMEDAFVRTDLEDIVENSYCVESSTYKILRKTKERDGFVILTDRGKIHDFHNECIRYTAMSASAFRTVVKVTKTEIIEIFATIPFSDIWTATFYKKNIETDWAMNFVKEITKMSVEKAAAYTRSNIDTINKTERTMTGKKNSIKPNNNMYSVRDLVLYFDELTKSKDVKSAEKCSFRYLDVNSITTLIYNNIKYVKK